MAKNKTVENETSVENFIETIKDDKRRKDCIELIALIKKETRLEPKMWGPGIVGFGSHRYKYESGREGDSPNIAFSPRASSIAIYLSANFDDRKSLLEKLGKHKTDKGCVHIKALADVDITILEKMISKHLDHIKEL